VNDDALEKAIQQHLFKHLWLLDPSWERATGTEYMEQQVDTEFKKLNAKLTKEEKEGRVDIKYATRVGPSHLIIELKRAKRVDNQQRCGRFKPRSTATGFASCLIKQTRRPERIRSRFVSSDSSCRTGRSTTVAQKARRCSRPKTSE